MKTESRMLREIIVKLDTLLERIGYVQYRIERLEGRIIELEEKLRWVRR